MKKFAIVGVAGYIAPRHLKAIKTLGGELVAAFDPNDSVGVLDSYFPQAAFFTEFERFDRHLEKRKRRSEGIDYLVICSPNYLHDAHIRYGLKMGAEVICEKPLVLNPWNLEAIEAIEHETGKKVWSILQMRLHPVAAALKTYLVSLPDMDNLNAELTYITPRGPWYYASWKGDMAKSGGIITNIGIHLFDLLLSTFGNCTGYTLHQHNYARAAGVLFFENIKVKWFLSIEPEALQQATNQAAPKPLRTITINDQTWDFSEGFTDLHTGSYQQIIDQTGFRIPDNAPAITLTHQLRNTSPVPDDNDQHPLCALPLSRHPFQ